MPEKAETMSDKGLPAAWFYRLKAAQRDLIDRCGGIQRSRDIASISQSQMGRFNNAGDPELMPLAVVLVLERECGMPLVTQAMAELNGRRLADADAGVAGVGATIMTAHAEVVGHAAELIATGAQVFLDGKVTPTEAAAMDRKASALEAAAGELRKQTAAARAGGVILKAVGE